MGGFGGGFVSGAGQGAATGAAIGGPWGAAIGGVVGGIMGGLGGNSASRARKWQRIAAARQAEWNALKNRRQFLQGVRELRATRASQVQATSTDLNTDISGAQGSLASLGSQFEYDYLQFDKDLWYENYVNDALRKAGQASTQAAQYQSTLNAITDISSAFSSVYEWGKDTEQPKRTPDIIEAGGSISSGVRYS